MGQILDIVIADLHIMLQIIVTWHKKSPDIPGFLNFNHFTIKYHEVVCSAIICYLAALEFMVEFLPLSRVCAISRMPSV
jgi:hypothetical protein